MPRLTGLIGFTDKTAPTKQSLGTNWELREGKLSRSLGFKECYHCRITVVPWGVRWGWKRSLKPRGGFLNLILRTMRIQEGLRSMSYYIYYKITVVTLW